MDEADEDLVRRFSWWRFAKTIATEALIVGALQCYWYWSEGGWKAVNLAVLAILAWVNLFMGWRWVEARRWLREGTFPVDDYRANPQDFYLGGLRRRLCLITSSVVIMLLWAVYATWSKHQ